MRSSWLHAWGHHTCGPIAERVSHRPQIVCEMRDVLEEIEMHELQIHRARARGTRLLYRVKRTDALLVTSPSYLAHV